MIFFRQNSPDDYVSLSQTNGSAFGLVSVDLADPNSPSLSPVGITFNGYLADNSLVSQTFTVGGGGATTFQNYTFNPSFGSGLTRVDILAPRWAMDNLVFIPEPGTMSLLAAGLLLGGAAWRRRRRA